MSERSLPDFAAIEKARERIKDRIMTTPFLESEELNQRLGGRLFVKLEPLQVGGAFKIRGALSALTALSEEKRKAGIIAFSSGNHAIAVSTAARMLGTTAVIVMPADAPQTKLERTRANGAEIVTYDRETEDREEICARLAAERGLSMIKPFDDPMVIAGQGTIALEIAEQARAAGIELEALAVPCSGGGLAAGCALALGERSPKTRIVTVEPEGFDDMARSLETGAKATNERVSGSIADALLVKTPGDLTLPILAQAKAKGVVVSDEEALGAMRVALETFKVVVEPGGAVALAAALSGKFPVAGRTVAVICSGGNVDRALLARAIG